MKKLKNFLIATFNVLLPLILALLVVFILIIGKKPLDVYGFIVNSAFFKFDGLMNTLGFAAPLIMTGIATALSYTANVYNMGIEGQLYMGAWFATYIGFTFQGLPPGLHIPLCLLGGMIAGMLYSLIPAIFKAYFRINEVVVTIMLNSVATIFTTYLTNGPFKDNVGYSATYAINKSAQLSRLFPKYRLTTSIFIALAILAMVWFVLRRTRFGYEIKAIGKQREFSDAVGMNVRRKTIIVFLIGGAIAGIAGATEMMGVNIRFTPNFSTNPGLGWDGQAVCLLANRNPLGVLITAILFGAFKFGGISLQAKLGVPSDLINIIQSTLILFLSARYINKETKVFERIGEKLKRPHQKKEARSNG
jgi:simple sugar transport system permease protein